MKTRNLNSGVVSDTGVYDAARLNPNLQTYAAKTLTFTNALCEFADDFFLLLICNYITRTTTYINKDLLKSMAMTLK